jgi:hypothetical protein
MPPRTAAPHIRVQRIRRLLRQLERLELRELDLAARCQRVTTMGAQRRQGATLGSGLEGVVWPPGARPGRPTKTHHQVRAEELAVPSGQSNQRVGKSVPINAD